MLSLFANVDGLLAHRVMVVSSCCEGAMLLREHNSITAISD